MEEIHKIYYNFILTYDQFSMESVCERRPGMSLYAPASDSKNPTYHHTNSEETYGTVQSSFQSNLLLQAEMV